MRCRFIRLLIEGDHDALYLNVASGLSGFTVDPEKTLLFNQLIIRSGRGGEGKILGVLIPYNYQFKIMVAWNKTHNDPHPWTVVAVPQGIHIGAGLSNNLVEHGGE